MKTRYLYLLITILLIPAVCTKAQNSNLLLKYYSGAYNSMGHTGIAANNHSSFDVNPAVLTNYKTLNISLAGSFKYYSYDLVRISSQVGGTSWAWNNSKITFEQASIVYPVSKKFSFGIGMFQKLDPQFVNKGRANTFSDLFFQETKGSIYSAVLSAAYKINDDISVGMSIYDYFGNINSRVTGDNHGNDLDKWAYLENKLSGINFRGGILLKKEKWSAGLVFESPFKMNVKAAKDISYNLLFKSLLPSYDQAELNMPWIIGAGVSYNGLKNWLFELNLETRQYKKSDVKFNLYEFGGLPVWESTNILRAGIQYLFEGDINIPIRAGYAYIPQQYYSQKSNGVIKNPEVVSYNLISKNSDRNIKHVFTLGTSYSFNLLTINFNLEYSKVRWDRSIFVPASLNDEYSENDLIFLTEFVYNFN